MWHVICHDHSGEMPRYSSLDMRMMMLNMTVMMMMLIIIVFLFFAYFAGFQRLEESGN